MGYIILPAKEIEELQNIDIRPGQVIMFGDSLSDGNITMKGLGGSIKDLTEIGGTEGTIRYNEEADKIEIQRAGEWKGSDSAGGDSIKYGTNKQIPYMDPEGTEFNYIENLRTSITTGETTGREIVQLHVDSWGIKSDTLTVANSLDPTAYYTKIGNSGKISGSNNNSTWEIHNNGENTTFRTSGQTPLHLGTNDKDQLTITGAGVISINTLGTGTADKLLAVDDDGNIVDGSSLAGSGGSGFTVSATDNQIPYVDSTNAAYEYSNNLTYNETTLTVIGANTNDVLINTYTTGQSSGTDAQTFSVKSRGDLSGAINGKAWKLSRFSSSSVLFGSTSNHPLSIGAGTDIGGSNKTGGHMHINPNGNITIGDDTFDSGSPVNGYSKGARLYVKSDASGTNLHLASNSDVTLFKVLNDGTINIPSTSIKATPAATLLAVDDDGNIVDGSSLAGSGGSNSNITYGNTNDIPYVNGNTDGFSYDTTNTFTYDGDGRLLVNHASADRESFSATNSANNNAAILGTANGLQLFRGGANDKEFKIDNTGTNVIIGTDGTSAQNIIFNAGAQTTAPVQLQSTDGLLKYVDGNQTAGHVLTSDVDGVATWQLPSSGNNSSNVNYGLSTQIPIIDSSNTGFRYSAAFTVGGDNTNASMQIKNSGSNWIGLKVLDYNNNYTNINSTGLVGTTNYSISGNVKTPYLGWKISRLSDSGIFIASTDGNKSLFLSTKDNNTNAARVFEMTSTGDVMLGKRHHHSDETASLAIFNDTDDGTSSVLKLLANTGTATTVSYVDIIDFKNDGTINIPSTSIKATGAVTLLAVDANGNVVDGSSLAGSGGSGSNITYGDAGNIPFVNTAEDGFDYTDVNSSIGFLGKLTFDSGTLTVRGLIPTDNSSYTDKKALTTLSVVKSHDNNNVKQSLTVRGDGTVFIGESSAVNGTTLSGNLYQNVLGIHEMSVAAISEMENQTYIHKIYVDSTDGGRLMFKTDTGTTSLLNAWAAVKDANSSVERTTLTGYNQSILELRSGTTSGSGSNTFGTSSQGNTIVAAQGAKIGTNGGTLTENQFSNSIIVSGGGGNFATHGDSNNSVLVGNSSSIQSGIHNFVFGGSSHVYHTASGNDHNFIAGNGNYAHGFKNTIIGSSANLNPGSLYVNNRFSNPVPDHIKYSTLIGNQMYAARDNQILIGNGFNAAYVPVPMVAITPNKAENGVNRTGSFAIYWPVDSTGNATSDFKAHNMVFGINAVKAEAKNGLGGSPISQYSGQNIFQLVHGHNKSLLREPTGKINNTFSMWPISVTQETSDTLLGKTGLKMKTSGTVNSGNVTNDARYHFLGESAIFNGGIHAERHADKDISVIAIGRGNNSSTSSIQSKNINNEVTFDVRDDGVVIYKSLTFGNLPSAATATGGQVFLTSGGSETNVMVYSNGTSWISMVSGSPIILGGAA